MGIKNNLSLDDMLEDVQVSDDWECAREAGNQFWPNGWWAVSTSGGGIVAYFEKEADAYWYRLALINMMLNGKTMRAGHALDYRHRYGAENARENEKDI